MALAIDIIDGGRYPDRSGREVIADVTFDSSYPTGGESLTPADLGLKRIEHLVATQKGVANRICEYDYANQKLLLFTALGTEAANASNQSAIVVRIHALGDHFAALDQ